MKCDKCGKFCKKLHDVWAGGAYPEIDYVACTKCYLKSAPNWFREGASSAQS